MSISRIAPLAIMGAGLLIAAGLWLGLRADRRHPFRTGGPRFAADWPGGDLGAPPPYARSPGWGPFAWTAASGAGMPRLTETIVVEDGAVYVASNGTLRAFEAKTLKPLGEAAYRGRSGSVPDTEGQ